MLRSKMVLPPGVISNAEGGGEVALGRNKCPLCGPTVCLRSMPYFPRQPGLYSVSALTVVCQCTRLCSTVSALDRILCSRYPVCTRRCSVCTVSVCSHLTVWCSVCTVSVPDHILCSVPDRIVSALDCMLFCVHG